MGDWFADPTSYFVQSSHWSGICNRQNKYSTRLAGNETLLNLATAQPEGEYDGHHVTYCDGALVWATSPWNVKSQAAKLLEKISVRFKSG